MAEQEKKQRPSTPSEKEPVETTAQAQASEEAMSGLGEILDEIDEVLESNAEEFVKNYVQKGGE